MRHSLNEKQLPIVAHMIEIGIIVILTGCVYSELFDGYFRSIWMSSTVVCNDSDIT
jgi:FlaG/FlaF family flagellin (archaellin)